MLIEWSGTPDTYYMTNNTALCAPDTPSARASSLLDTLVGDLFLDIPLSDLVGSTGDVLLGQIDASRITGGEDRWLPTHLGDGAAATPSTTAERRAA